MRRFDLRHLDDNFYEKMEEIITKDLTKNEVGIFLFKIGDFSSVQKSADLAEKLGCELVNSLKFNQLDWTIVVRRVS